MTDKELKKLSRAELLELLLIQTKEVERLQNELEDTKKRLEDKNIIIEESGSIAEAALKLNGVFEAAEKAAQQYIDNMKRLSKDNDNEEEQKDN